MTQDRRIIRLTRRQCFVAHPFQRNVLKPPWPPKWGEFSQEKFDESLELVTVIRFSRVTGLDRAECPDHGADYCPYPIFPGAEYLVLGGQHRTLEGGRVLGPDWGFQVVELLVDVPVTELSRRWWTTENRRNAGTREVFARQVTAEDPAYLAMATALHGSDLDYRRGSPLTDFTPIGSLPGFWAEDEEAARRMLRVLGEARVGTRLALVRALFEIAHWDLRMNQGRPVRWDGPHGLTGTLQRLSDQLRRAEQATGVSGSTTWQRVANTIAGEYNKHRTSGRVTFSQF